MPRDESQEILPDATRGYPYYVVVPRYRRRSVLRPFLGTYSYTVRGITSVQEAEDTTGELFKSFNEAHTSAMKWWAQINHPLRVLIVGLLFNPKLIQYRRDWAREWQKNFWDR